MNNRRMTFTGVTGSRLSGLLSLPSDGQVQAHALFAHCFTCSKDLKAVVNISRVLTARCIGVFRFDFTGLGESEGDFSDSLFSSNVGDLVAAASHLEQSAAAPTILIGHSLGGAAALVAAAQIPSVRAVATIGAPFDPGHVTHLFSNSLEEIEEQGQATVVLGGRRFTLTKDFVKDVTSQCVPETVRALRKPLLIFHAPGDRTVDIDNAARLYEAARHPKSFVSLDDADHLLSREKDSLYVGDVLASWAGRYITVPEVETTVEELRE